MGFRHTSSVIRHMSHVTGHPSTVTRHQPVAIQWLTLSFFYGAINELSVVDSLFPMNTQKDAC